MFNTKKAVEDKSYRRKAKRRVDASIVLSLLGVLFVLIYSILNGKIDDVLQGLKLAGFFVALFLVGMVSMSGVGVVSRLFGGVGKAVSSLTTKAAAAAKRFAGFK